VSPDSAVDEQYLRRALEAATHAPSIHNTQPWRFRLSGGGDHGTVELYADRERSLYVLDPTGRQMLMSCGAALLFLKVALRADGFDADVDLLPDADRDHLGSVAVRRGAPPSPEESALAAAIFQRHTQRAPFDPREVAAELIDELREAAEAEGAWVSVLHRRDDQLALITVLARADHEEAMDAAYRDELRAWVRTDPSPDGIPVAVLPGHGERHTEVTIRDFNPDRVAEEADEARRPTCGAACRRAPGAGRARYRRRRRQGAPGGRHGARPAAAPGGGRRSDRVDAGSGHRPAAPARLAQARARAARGAADGATGRVSGRSRRRRDGPAPDRRGAPALAGPVP